MTRPCSARPGFPRSAALLLTPFPFPSCVPEFFGDTILVNGTAYPVLEVEARPVRIRMLNACSSRFLNPRLVATAGHDFPRQRRAQRQRSRAQVSSRSGPRAATCPRPRPVGAAGIPASSSWRRPNGRTDLIDFTKASRRARSSSSTTTRPARSREARRSSIIIPGTPKTPDVHSRDSAPTPGRLLKIRVKAADWGRDTAARRTIIWHRGSERPVARHPDARRPDTDPDIGDIRRVTYPGGAARLLTLNEGFDQYGRLAQFLGDRYTSCRWSSPGFFGRDL